MMVDDGRMIRHNKATQCLQEASLMMIYLQMIGTEAHRSKFEQIYTQYSGLMYHVAYRLLQHPQDAEDAVHLAFVTIAEHIGKIGDPGPRTKSYVAIISEHKALDMLRKRHRHGETELDETFTGTEIEYTGDDPLARCINRLPMQQRHVIWLKYHYGYDLREIAKILKLSHAAAIKTDQRAKAKLRELLKEEDIHVF